MSRIAVPFVSSFSACLLLLAGAAGAHPGHVADQGAAHHYSSPFHLAESAVVIAAGGLLCALAWHLARRIRAQPPLRRDSR